MTQRRLISGSSPYEPKLGYSRAVVQGGGSFFSRHVNPAMKIEIEATVFKG
ncbi:hypothetical protein DT23_10820 [Thioclava indica]|uniref:RidA family protein n=1 Tax=Thioclava indica TaxID=1353528 RepID=A0A074KHJ6_9RHOB|nr:hypothetical protein DT23_10820 [Thioclava indica]